MSKNSNPNKQPLGVRIQNATARFLYGRNGVDQLNILILVLYSICILVASVVQGYVGLVLNVLGLIFLIWFFFRTLSKNLEKRRKENAKLVAKMSGVKSRWKFRQQKWKDRKTHVYKKCPSCKKVLRAKRRKGTKTVNCPHCGTPVVFKIHIKGELDKLDDQQKKAETARAKAEEKAAKAAEKEAGKNK